MNGLEEAAPLRLVRDDGWFAGLAAFAHALTRIQAQIALEFLAFRTVAFVTPFHQHGPDARFEKFEMVACEGAGAELPSGGKK
jgi:hypothetical protein